MNIIFIHQYDYYEPLGIMILSAFLKDFGHRCELVDLKFERNYLTKIRGINPDIIAYTVTSNKWKFYQRINENLKNYFEFVSVFGGPHATFYPELIEEKGVDVVCRGEGEYAFKDLADAIQNGTDYTSIKNLWVKRNGRIFKNELRPLISNLDDLPFPDRALINKYAHYRKRSRVRTITSRGCPYNCSYCFNYKYRKLYQGKGKYIRHRSPQNVIHEIKQLVKMYLPRNIEFHDDIFILDKTWLEEFIHLKKKYGIDIPFEANVRANLVTPKIADLLQEADCYSVQFGIETGNFKLRKRVLNRDISDEMIIHAAKLFRSRKIKINSFNMVGIPGETVKDTEKTIRLNAKARVSYAMNTIYQPFPGTVLADKAVEMGLYSGNVSAFDKNYLYGKSVIKLKDRKRIERLHYLFAFGVKFPLLIPFLLFLSYLPFNRFYQLWYFLYRAYSVIFIFKRIKIREAFIREKF